MKIENLLVTDENAFIDRHKFLLVEMAKHLNNVEFLLREIEWFEKKNNQAINKKPRSLLRGIGEQIQLIYFCR